MEFKDYTCKEFTDALAGKVSVPGGGAGAAICAAMGTALGNMVGAFTVGKKKYADVEDEIKELSEECTRIQNELLLLADADAEAFAPLAESYGLPTGTEEERAFKDEVTEKALYSACESPVNIIKKCGEAMEVIEKLADKGSKMMISDAGCAMSVCRGALEAAALNIFVNTKSMKNRAEAENYNGIANEYLYVYTTKADKVFAKVKKELSYVDPNKKKYEMPDFDSFFAGMTDADMMTPDFDGPAAEETE